MFHLTMFSASVAAVTDSDIAAPADQVLMTRNNHPIITVPFGLIAGHLFGSLTSRARFGNAQFTVDVQPHIYPLDVAAAPPDLPAVVDYRDDPLDMPVNEEITLLGTTTAAGPSNVNLAMFLAPPSWNRNVPAGTGPFWVRGTTVSPAGAARTWSNPANIAFERDPRQGVYAVIGGVVVSATGTAFRIIFPNPPVYKGYPLRPGGNVFASIGLEPWKPQTGVNGGLGEWGRFHTFNPPQVQLFDDAAGGTNEVRLLVIRVGNDMSLLFQNQTA